MNDILAIDHVVMIVDDLSKGIKQFKKLGFTVTPGGVHAGGLTHNALIGLEDGTYLELVAFTNSSLGNLLRLIKISGTWQLYSPTRTPMGKRFLGLIANGPGLGDFALLSKDLGKTIAEVKTRGLTLESPSPGRRMRPDHQEVSWRATLPPTSDLPFLIEDVTPHELRLPPMTARQHENDVTGIAEITVGVADITESIVRYRSLLGLEAELPTQAPMKGLQPEKFAVGSEATIKLVLLPGSDKQAHRYLMSREGRPLKLILKTRNRERFSLEHNPKTGYALTIFH
jgi:catechol 2,3-dioxygenase-like lactoylglutathione lyase family enzyme